MRLTALRHPKESPKLLTRNLMNSRPKITPKLPNPSNKTVPQENAPVLPNTGKPRRGDRRGEQYGPDASCAPTPIISHTETTNKTTPSIDRDSPHTINRILEPKDSNGTLQHPTQVGRAVVSRCDFLRGRHPAPAQTIGDGRGLSAPPPHSPPNIYRYDFMAFREQTHTTLPPTHNSPKHPMSHLNTHNTPATSRQPTLTCHKLPLIHLFCHIGAAPDNSRPLLPLPIPLRGNTKHTTLVFY